ncbi:PIH1 domain-containing protein 1-like [Halichondria panicea]|uniref:PIH1 domain-containing protein 1-like n=1 Tax=Halichondria panicea TaxID=6063 RepID=UPI00312B562D
MDSLLLEPASSDESPAVPDSVMKNLVIKGPDEDSNEPVSRVVIPEAGFCLKTRTDKEEKIFINVCQSEQVPSPKEISDEQLATMLESGDASQYRVPISLGEPHTVHDNTGKECRAFDVVVGAAFFESIQKRASLKEFLLTIVLEGIEEKYQMLLSRDCKILKNRKFIGDISEQTIRKKSKPFIIDMDRGDKEASKEESHYPEPRYTIMREPVTGDVPEFLVCEVYLTGITTSQGIRLDVGEDRLELSTRPPLFQLNLDLPYTLDPDNTGAQFNRASKLLTVTLPVTGKAPY